MKRRLTAICMALTMGAAVPVLPAQTAMARALPEYPPDEPTVLSLDYPEAEAYYCVRVSVYFLRDWNQATCEARIAELGALLPEGDSFGDGVGYRDEGELKERWRFEVELKSLDPEQGVEVAKKLWETGNFYKVELFAGVPRPPRPEATDDSVALVTPAAVQTDWLWVKTKFEYGKEESQAETLLEDVLRPLVGAAFDPAFNFAGTEYVSKYDTTEAGETIHGHGYRYNYRLRLNGATEEDVKAVAQRLMDSGAVYQVQFHTDTAAMYADAQDSVLPLDESIRWRWDNLPLLLFKSDITEAQAEAFHTNELALVVQDNLLDVVDRDLLLGNGFLFTYQFGRLKPYTDTQGVTRCGFAMMPCELTDAQWSALVGALWDTGLFHSVTPGAQPDPAEIPAVPADTVLPLEVPAEDDYFGGRLILRFGSQYNEDEVRALMGEEITPLTEPQSETTWYFAYNEDDRGVVLLDVPALNKAQTAAMAQTLLDTGLLHRVDFAQAPTFYEWQCWSGEYDPDAIQQFGQHYYYDGNLYEADGSLVQYPVFGKKECMLFGERLTADFDARIVTRADGTRQERATQMLRKSMDSLIHAEYWYDLEPYYYLPQMEFNGGGDYFQFSAYAGGQHAGTQTVDFVNDSVSYIQTCLALGIRSVPRGDIDLDGKSDVADAVRVARLVSEDKESRIAVSALGRKMADVNASGTVDADDLTALLRRLAGYT